MLEEKKLFIDLFTDENKRVEFSTFNDNISSSPPANGMKDKVSIKVNYGYIYKKDTGKYARYWEINKPKSSEVKINFLKDWSNVKTIAFTPGVVVPRYKLQKLKEKTGLTVIRDMAKADVVITSYRSIQEYTATHTEGQDRGLITAIALKNRIMNYPASLKIPGMTQVLGLLNTIADNTEILVSNALCQFIAYYHIADTAPASRYVSTNPSGITLEGEQPGIFTQEGQDQLARLSSYNLVNENDLNALLGESTLDATAYEMLTKMIQSTSFEDRAVAISIVGNCNFVDSYKYGLAWFIKNIGYIIVCKQPVAFRAFRAFIGYEKLYRTGINYVFKIDTIIEAALQNNVYHDGFMEELAQIDDLNIQWTDSKLIKPIKFDLTKQGQDIVNHVNQPI